MGFLNRAVRAAVASVPLVLAACGGGGTQTLTVTFSYPNAQSDLRASIRIVPTLAGLQGHSPSCTLAAGQLPPGVTVDASTCVVSGAPTAAGFFSFSIRLTSSNVQGSVDGDGSIVVVDPTPQFFYSGGSLNNLRYAQAFSSLPLLALNNAYVAQPGDSLRFSALGPLSAGLVLDPVTSAVQGTPTGFGSQMVQIVGTLVRGGVSYPSSPVSVSFDVSSALLTVTYPICLVPVATLYTCTPNFDNPAAAAGLTFTYASSDLPAGFAIDTSTGVITGVLNTVSSIPVTVSLRTVYPAGGAQNATLGALVWTAGIFPQWGMSNANFGVNRGPIGSFLPGFSEYVELAPGAAFGMDETVLPGGGVPGDIYTYALVPYDAVTPLPPWISIDPATGHLFGIAPGSGMPAMFTVQLTAVRHGLTFVSLSTWIVVLL